MVRAVSTQNELTSGSRFGSLDVIGPLGAGGMGVVYRAHDSTLGRTVALKILPDIFADDPDRLARFDHEARTLASLNHPNIAQIYGLEHSGATRALVMELVEGEDLSQRIARGPLPAQEAFAIARQIASALEAAHEFGIIHRDLKPANVRIREDGTVKVLDFGLAKAIDAGSSSSGVAGTMTSPAVTAHGVILGTAAYMAPEQARGRTVDKRADVWAFGVVLYEMLTGTRLFEGESVADTIALVVSRDPDMSLVPLPASHRVRRLLRRCLERDPRQRLRDIGEARIVLESGDEVADAGPPAVSSLRSAGAAWIVATAALVALGVGAGWWIGNRSIPPQAAFETFTQLTNQSGEETTPALSPDGASIAYASRAKGTWDVYVQRVGGRNPILVAGDPKRDESAPAFSPDGVTIAFHESDRDGGIFVAGATGESARRLTDFGFDPAWSGDGRQLVFATEEALDPYTRHSVSALWRVDAAGGSAPNKITDGDAIQPAWSPSGKRIAFWANTGGQRDMFTIAPDGSGREPVLSDAPLDWSPTWSADGRHLYFASDRGGSMNLWRVAIDEASGRVLAKPEAVTKGVHASADRPSLSKDGSRIVFRSEIRTVNPVAVSFDPATERLGPIRILIHANDVLTPTGISPDGQWLLLSSQSGRRDDIFICRTDGSGLRRLTDDVYRDRWPRWSRDGQEVFFYSNRTERFEIWAIKIDGSGLRRISDQTDRNIHFPTLSPSGDRLIASAQTTPDSWIADPSRPWNPENARKLEALGTHAEWLIPIDWSPDGRRLLGPMMSRAGTINGFGVYDFASGGTGRLSVRHALGDGYRLAWLPDSRRVLIVDRGNRILLVDTVTGRERTLLEGSPWRFWGNVPPISPDGRTFYLGSLEAQSDVWMVAR